MVLSGFTLGVLLLALIIDRVIGDPEWLWSRIPHPVVIFGNLIGQLDETLNAAEHNNPSARQRGLLTVSIVVLLALISGVIFHVFLRALPFGTVVEAILAAFLIAQKSLLDHLRAVSRAISEHGLDAGRTAVSKIVGRETENMDEADISRAAIESAAENFSDGVVAPAFWYLLFGLPGLFVYKVVNTADSMIGHKTDRYIQFGYVAARLDDLLNFIPSRISGVLVAASAPILGGKVKNSLSAMQSDAPGHVSPNAGWPEAAMAGALDVALGGPRRYKDKVVDGIWINSVGNRFPNRFDIDRSVKLLDAAWLLITVSLAVVFALAMWF